MNDIRTSRRRSYRTTAPDARATRKHEAKSIQQLMIRTASSRLAGMFAPSLALIVTAVSFLAKRYRQRVRVRDDMPTTGSVAGNARGTGAGYSKSRAGQFSSNL